MTTSSSAEFLTFMRYATTRSSLRSSTIRSRPCRAINSRIATASQFRYASGTAPGSNQFPEDKHTTDKNPGSDLQSGYAKAGKESRTKDDGGDDHATAEKDFTNSTSKAKKDHPEAPDVVIGMQDERGSRGA